MCSFIFFFAVTRLSSTFDFDFGVDVDFGFDCCFDVDFGVDCCVDCCVDVIGHPRTFLGQGRGRMPELGFDLTAMSPKATLGLCACALCRFGEG